MPNRLSHNYFTRLFLGKSYSEVHKAIDQAWVFAGRRHRRFFHDPFEAYVMGCVAAHGSYGGLAGLLHVWLDKQCSKDKNFKKWLEFMAKQDAMWRKQMRQWKKLMKRKR